MLVFAESQIGHVHFRDSGLRLGRQGGGEATEVQPRSQSSRGSRGTLERSWQQSMYWYKGLLKTCSAYSCIGTWIVPRLILRHQPIRENFANEAVQRLSSTSEVAALTPCGTYKT